MSIQLLLTSEQSREVAQTAHDQQKFYVVSMLTQPGGHITHYFFNKWSEAMHCYYDLHYHLEPQEKLCISDFYESALTIKARIHDPIPLLSGR